MKHINSLQKSYELSSQQIDDVVNPIEVAALFEKEKVAYVLIGGHMLSYYTNIPRATVDVDFIIRNADFSRAAEIINQAYTQFRYHDQIYHVTYDSKKPQQNDPERIDLIKDEFPLFREVVQHYCYSVKSASHTIKVPTIEAAIALKFAACISPNRGAENKSIDNADLLRLVRSGFECNESILNRLGDLIYQGGGKELISIVKDINAGKNISL